MGVERLAVFVLRLLIWFQVGHFPAGLAYLGAGRGRVGKTLREFLAHKAMLCIGLPVHVNGELHEGAKTLSLSRRASSTRLRSRSMMVSLSAMVSLPP